MLLLFGCSSGAEECVEVQNDCSPLYEPVFETIVSRTLVPKCSGGSVCHSLEGRRGGIVLDSPDDAYRYLVEEGRVDTESVGCSLLVERLNGQGGTMPPGNPLSEAERCSIEQWIALGATR